MCPYDDNEKTTIGNYEYAEKLFKQNNSVVAENESFEVPWYIWAIAGLVILLIPIAITIKKAKKKVTPKKEEPQKEIISNTKPEEDCYIAYKRGYEPSNYIAGSLFQSYIVGKDIPEGETVFSARSKRNGNITIYKSNDEIILQERIDFTKSFRVYLKTGEKVNTFNCRWKSTNAPIERSEEE